jgi:hypothetical protein
MNGVSVKVVGAKIVLEVDILKATGENPINYIVRHMNLDPGVLGVEDELANLQAVREGRRVFSAYEPRDGTRIWIITEADRSATTILLPEEY